VNGIILRKDTEHDPIPFKELVGLVARQEEGDVVGKKLNCVSHDDLPVVLESSVIGEGEFSQAHESMEPRIYEGKKEEVVVMG
jgi:hypothetical protein